jgi:biopolymer transport protein ExbD
MIEIPASKRGDIIADLMPDLTPLLDVMFMLIVFFILTANAVPYALDVNLPEDAEEVSQAVEDPDMLSVTLMPDEGGWKINDTLYKAEEAFKAALKEQTKNNDQVIIIGDKDVSMQKLLTVMAFLRKHNIKAADIIMKQR